MIQYTTYIFLLLLWVYTLAAKRPIIETPLGKIKGHYKTSYGGRTFSAFEGIPYAKPPLGDLRFEEPQNAEPWSGIWDATVVHECIQLIPMVHQITGNEDCLYINVYVPKEKPVPHENLNVVVHIHGGAFILGSPSQFGPEYFMDRDVIFVNLNYRLGALGFLSTQDDIVPGNNGMKDQVLSLRWVQNNIEYFGGNRNSITLTGLSAGAVAVHFHYISPLSKGLFHRAISQSGTVLNPWAIQKAPLEKAKKLAASVGCDYVSTKEFIYCMRQRPVKDIVQNVNLLSVYPELLISIFAPVVEKEHETAFLVEHPFKLLDKGDVYDVPWITSATTEEGIFPAAIFINRLDEINAQWNEIMPHLLEYRYTVTDTLKPIIGEKIKSFYFDTKKISKDNFPTLIKLFGDRHFLIDFEKAARMQAKSIKSPVYAILYGHRGEQSLCNIFGIDKNYGVSHGDDAMLLYYQTTNTRSTRKKLSTSDEAIKELLLDIVTSFAENGKPEVKGINWKPVVDSSDFEYLFIRGSNETAMAFAKEVAPQKFWNSIRMLENENIANIIKDEL